MLHDHVLVRKLVGIETAGSLNLLFTDKTGTITKGQLEVVCFLTGDLQEITEFTSLPARLNKLTCQQVLINTSSTVTDGKIVGGNMTEAALNNYVGDYRLPQLPQRQRFIPFNSANKYSWAQVAPADGGAAYCLIKGAPEKLLQATDWYWSKDGSRLPLTYEMKAALDNRMMEFAGQAIRMLALCTYQGIPADNLPDKGLTIAGVVAIRDDVRPEAVEAIKTLQQAGVQVVMMTGYRKETGDAIAKDAGAAKRGGCKLTSDELEQMSDDEVKAKLTHLRVVARALPMDKSRLVRLAQELNLVTGMTGDGVNDSPALKRLMSALLW